jgi:choline kinase
MEYEKRKILFENLKMLVTSEYEEIFRILKRNNESYTENSNGIFFDVMTIKNETYTDMQNFMDFCLKTRQNDVDRQKELEGYRGEIK